ncbi:MAG TPA: MFS transporter [Solirubrobacteraceae bacterium]|nr:MFS transporter [Solirubrobacteraceae bacterium]
MTATSETAFHGGPRAALSVRPFRWWFLGQITSASGLMTQMVAVGWLVLRWHGSGVQLGLLSSAGLGPTLVLGLWAGSLIDHYDRRTILIWTQSLMTALSLLLYALIVTRWASYWPLVAIMLANGTVNALDAPARQIYVLDLVGPERLAGAVSLYEVILNLSRVLGPAIGGLLLAISGPAACVLINALSFLAPLTVLLVYRPAKSQSPRDAGEGRPSAMAGLRYAWSQPLLRACLLIGASCGVLFSPTLFFPLLATRVFHMGGSGYGLLLALFGSGAVPGALLASRRKPSGTQVRALAIATGICVLIAAAAPGKLVLFIGIIGIGASSIWMVASANTLVQLRAAPELRGRVMGAWTVALPGTIPITALLAGGAADLFGPRIAYGAVGAVIAGVALLCWRAYADASDG